MQQSKPWRFFFFSFVWWFCLVLSEKLLLSVSVINRFTARLGTAHFSGIRMWPWTLLLHVSSSINLFRQGIRPYWLSPRWNGQTQGRDVWEAGLFRQRSGHWAAINNQSLHGLATQGYTVQGQWLKNICPIVNRMSMKWDRYWNYTLRFPYYSL